MLKKEDTEQMCVRINKKLKRNAEVILSELGITPTCAIHMLYSQIVLTRSFPLDLKLPELNVLNISDLSEDEDYEDEDFDNDDEEDDDEQY